MFIFSFFDFKRFSFKKTKQNLEPEELTTVRKNLEGQKISVDVEFVSENN